MRIIYEQILKSNEIVQGEDKRYSVKYLLKDFKEVLSNNNYIIVEEYSENKSPIDILVRDESGNLLRLIVYMRNITGAGWANKKNRKRVQVQNIRLHNPEKYIPTQSNQAMFILGYYNYDNNPIYVAWDSYRYTNHKTNRSCYVGLSHLITGYEIGYYKGVSAEHIVWVFKEQYFKKFIEEYIDYIREFRNE